MLCNTFWNNSPLISVGWIKPLPCERPDWNSNLWNPLKFSEVSHVYNPSVPLRTEGRSLQGSYQQWMIGGPTSNKVGSLPAPEVALWPSRVHWAHVPLPCPLDTQACTNGSMTSCSMAGDSEKEVPVQMRPELALGLPFYLSLSSHHWNHILTLPSFTYIGLCILTSPSFWWLVTIVKINRSHSI